MGKIALVLAVFLIVASSAFAAEPRARTEMDTAVDRALEFLQRTQESDGGWRAGRSKSAAITGLCVMAFLSAGHVPREGPYGETVEKGVRWVLQAQRANGVIAVGSGFEMYHHGICALMLAEVAGMTDDKLGAEVRKSLERAVEVILKAQRSSGAHRGGWRYQVVGFDADISVTGWQLLALRASKNLGCDVPPESIDGAVEFVLRCQDPATGGFRYQPGIRETNAARTGTGILALEICGKERHRSPEALKAGGYLIRHPPRWGEQNFYYAVYYCSQAMFQLGDNYWKFYRPQLHETLLRNQSANGSWYGGDFRGREFGPQYGTAMGVLALTVEYRYLPIYQRDEEPENN